MSVVGKTILVSGHMMEILIRLAQIYERYFMNLFENINKYDLGNMHKIVIQCSRNFIGIKISMIFCYFMAPRSLQYIIKILTRLFY